MNSRRLTAYLLLLVVSIIWGTAGPVIKYTLAFFPPMLFLTYRLAISSAVSVATLAIHPSHNRFDARTLFRIFAHSFFAVILGLGLLFYGFDKTTSLTGVLLSSTGPIIVAIAGVLLLHEHITKHEWSGIAIALFGTLYITLAPILTNGHSKLLSFEGNLLIVGSLIADTIGAVIAKVTLRERVQPMVLVNTSFLIGFLTILPVLSLTMPVNTIIRHIVNAPLSAHLAVFYMALLSGTTAYTLQLVAMKSIELSEVAIFNYLFPVWAIPLSVFWLKESVTASFAVGAVIIALGVGIAEYKKRQLRTKLPIKHRKKKP